MSPNPHHRFRTLRNGLAASALAGLAAGLFPASPAIADPPRPDVAVTVTADPTEIVSIGGWANITAQVRNIGTGRSRDITLDLTLPAGWYVSDGFSIPPGWQCDYGTWICTHPPLEAGQSAAPLSIPYGVPAGAVGDAMTVRASVSAGPESSTTNNTAEATLRYIQGHVDLEVTTYSRDQELITGELTGVNPIVRNTGNLPSEAVMATVPLPAEMTRYSESGDGWDCAFGDTLANGGPGWRCTHGPLLAGETAAQIDLVATVTGGEPGDVLTLAATASTTSTESTLDNNTVRTTATVLQAATVRGTVWVDSDRDGVWDAGEVGIPTGSIDHIVVDSQTEGQPGVLATVNPDGTYLARVRPGSHRVEFYVRDSHLFTTSADSDLVYYENYTGGYLRYGYSGWFTLAGGEEAAIDAAVVSYYN